jgi:hypothetical protein
MMRRLRLGQLVLVFKFSFPSCIRPYSDVAEASEPVLEIVEYFEETMKDAISHTSQAP